VPLRVWRNEQMDVLRQQRPLSEADQERWYREVVVPAHESETPPMLLVSILLQGRFVGYGGLTNLDWDSLRGEVSFLDETARAADPELFGADFSAFLRFLGVLAFDELGLHRIVSETYAFRSTVRELLEANGFRKEGVLRDHVVKRGRYVDSILYGLVENDRTGTGDTPPAPGVGILVTSASRKAPLVRAFREALHALAVDGRVVAADSDGLAPAALEADAFWQMPPLDDLGDEELLEECRSAGIRLVVPTRDGELERFARLAPRFAQEGIHVAVSPAAALEACADKLAYARACAAAGFAAVETALAVEDVPGERLVVKERRGAGSRGVLLDVGRDEAARLAAGFAAPLFQPFVAGAELSVDLFAAADGVVGAVARTRDRVVSGESQVTTVVDAPVLVAECVALAARLGVRGHAVFQAIETPSGYRHIECNPRVGGASTLAFAAGLRTPEYLVREALGEPPCAPPAIATGLRLVRRPVDTVLLP